MTTLTTSSKDDFIASLVSNPNITALYEQLTALTSENQSLKHSLQNEQTTRLKLEFEKAQNQSKLTLYDTTLQNEIATFESDLRNGYEEQITALKQQISMLENELSNKTTQLQQLSYNSTQQLIHFDNVKNLYLLRSQQLYLQLVKYQRQDSLRVAKHELEVNSRAYLTLDKLGSRYHLDTIQGSRALANVTANTQALATKGESSEVLCTRDQVRLTVSGKLFETKSLGDIRWYRSQSGSAFTQIPNAGGRARADATVEETYGVCMTYIPTVDDINCTLRCQFVDPTSGATLVAEIGPVVPDKELLESAVEGYKKNEVECMVMVSESDVEVLVEKEKEWEKAQKEKSNKDHGRTSHHIVQKPNFLESLGMGGGGGVMSEFKLTLSTKKIVLSGKKNGKKIQTKIVMDSSIYIAAHSDTETGFSFYLFGNWVNCSAQNRQQRDVILALTRLFLQQTRISDFSTESERHREKQYSSAWMLSLINSDHDVVTAMPRSKIQQSQPLSIIQEDLNIGEILLQPKLQECSYSPDDVFIDVLQTDFNNVMHIDEDNNDDDDSNNNVDGETTNNNNNDDDDDGDNNDQVKNDKNEPDNKGCIWVTRAEFEANALLHTQFATIDFGPNRKQFLGQSATYAHSRHGSALSHHNAALSANSRASFSMSLAHPSVIRQQQQQQQRQQPQNNNNNDGDNNNNQQEQRTKFDDEYIPYDIDDVTPQLGQGKQRGFDDIVVGNDDSDDDYDENGQKVQRTAEQREARRQQRQQNNEENEHYAPAFEVKIKKAEEVQVDTAANSAKIKQIFNKNPLLALSVGQNNENDAPNIVSPQNTNLTSQTPSGATHNAFGRGRRQMLTTKITSPTHSDINTTTSHSNAAVDSSIAAAPVGADESGPAAPE